MDVVDHQHLPIPAKGTRTLELSPGTMHCRHCYITHQGLRNRTVTMKGSNQSYQAIWRQYDAIERRMSSPVTNRMLDLANLRAGMQVLDLATGRGEPAISAAKRVAPGGLVLGIDIDPTMLAMAREHADHERVSNLDLVAMDGETIDSLPCGRFDVALCRWGLMYLRDPVKGLQGIRHALSQGGALVLAVWDGPLNAVFFSLPRRALSTLLPNESEKINLSRIFYYAHSDRLEHDLALSGYRIQHTEEIEVDVIELRTNTELIAWARAFGMDHELDGLSVSVQKNWENNLIRLARSYRHNDGYIRLGGISRIVVAT